MHESSTLQQDITESYLEEAVCFVVLPIQHYPAEHVQYNCDEDVHTKAMICFFQFRSELQFTYSVDFYVSSYVLKQQEKGKSFKAQRSIGNILLITHAFLFASASSE